MTSPVQPSETPETPNAASVDTETPNAASVDTETPNAASFDTETPNATSFDTETPNAASFDTETALEPLGDGRYRTQVGMDWNIATHPNGGYLMSSMLRALMDASDTERPLSVTTHFLRPGFSGHEAEIATTAIRIGRKLSRYQATMSQGDKTIAMMLAALGHGESTFDPDDGPQLTMEPPELPDPASCLGRSGLEQGVDLPITSRLDVRLPANYAMAGTSGEAELSGWIRFRDGRDPDRLCLPLFTDAFPPTLFANLGYIGWVPTVEMTVHVRRAPAPGWIRGHFVCRDVTDSYMIEDGALWDSEGALVAQSRQIALVKFDTGRADARP